MAVVYKRKNEDIEALLERFKKECLKENIFKLIKTKEYFKSSKERKLEKILDNKRREEYERRNKNRNSKSNI
ncbi:MAG: small ribosomal subunit protein bS21 [Peptococcales bacterium]